MENLIPGTILSRQLPDGRYVSLAPLTFGRVRLCLGNNIETYEDFW